MIIVDLDFIFHTSNSKQLKYTDKLQSKWEKKKIEIENISWWYQPFVIEFTQWELKCPIRQTIEYSPDIQTYSIRFSYQSCVHVNTVNTVPV